MDLGDIGNIFQRTGVLASGFDELFEKGGTRMDENGMARENYAFGRLNGSGANEYMRYHSTPVGQVTQNAAGVGTNTMLMVGGGILVVILAFAFLKR